MLSRALASPVLFKDHIGRLRWETVGSVVEMAHRYDLAIACHYSVIVGDYLELFARE